MIEKGLLGLRVLLQAFDGTVEIAADIADAEQSQPLLLPEFL